MEWKHSALMCYSCQNTFLGNYPLPGFLFFFFLKSEAWLIKVAFIVVLTLNINVLDVVQVVC